VIVSLGRVLENYARARGWLKGGPFVPQQSEGEIAFADRLRESAPGVAWVPQAEARTPHGTFYLDLLGTLPSGRKIAVEYDGWDFHQDRARDLRRDALILTAGHVQAVYRFWDWCVKENLPGCLFHLAAHEPRLFPEGLAATLRGLHVASCQQVGESYRRIEFVRRHALDRADVRAAARGA
jgi:hypothetical protein